MAAPDLARRAARLSSAECTDLAAHLEERLVFEEDGSYRVEIDVLVGTQMIAKGLDFPNVLLVGVINADAALHFPDFRAGERTFQLVTQVAGRTGRGDDRSLILNQDTS